MNADSPRTTDPTDADRETAARLWVLAGHNAVLLGERIAQALADARAEGYRDGYGDGRDERASEVDRLLAQIARLKGDAPGDVFVDDDADLDR